MRTLKNRKMPGKVGDVTLKGINRWFKSVFEQLGYMVLAKSKGMTDKIQVYINSVHRLKQAIENKKTAPANSRASTSTKDDKRDDKKNDSDRASIVYSTPEEASEAFNVSLLMHY
jgi:hypothetical protein